MSKNRLSLSNIKRRFKYRSVEFNIEPYKKYIKLIEQVDIRALSDRGLQDYSRMLINKARSGVKENELLVEAYALVRESASRVLKMRPFDVQMIAAIAMHDRNLVEMQTGEGKTLTAVMPVYLNAISGKGVHVLTFNDYLAQRDAEWMAPLYNFLGLSIGFIREGMSIEERKYAYRCDITYLTAKEAGFDYLKEFLASEPSDIVQRPFNFAIIDEADSILIDEARIPLVIAGEVDEEEDVAIRMYSLVKGLSRNYHFNTDEYGRNVFLTDYGVNYIEDFLGCGNLYDAENQKLLVGIQNALHAQVLLKRDVDYIVRNGKVELVDEFTGRVADKRHWPYGLQEAIEAKEGVISKSKGKILASVTLQNFIRLYPKVSGMTGTAATSGDELIEFYNLQVVVIPTNKECIRVDEEDLIFSHKEAKYKALVNEIRSVHSTGRPMLVGTGSVEESEYISRRLFDAGIECSVLNAKNDRLEAEIIQRAGEVGAVTVSTNMAGRGTDIKLGGVLEKDRDKVVRLGGLYVIGTNKHESVRIDNQLRGRAGRQGDPGTSKFFISLDDDLLKKYKVKELIPDKFMPKISDSPSEGPVVRSRIRAGQRIIDGQNYDIRRTLTKYHIVLEQQRLLFHTTRKKILFGHSETKLMKERLPKRYNELLKQVGEKALDKAERQVSLYFINRCWADYIDYMAYVKESIHLVGIAGKKPVDEYNKTAIESLGILTKEIEDSIIDILSRVTVTKDGIDMGKEGLNAPTSTWTYLVDDRPEQLGINPIAANPMGALVQLPLWTIASIFYRYFKKVDQA